MPNETLNSMAQAYIDKLRTTFPDLEVDHYPDNAREYRLSHHKGAVLITLENRNFQKGQYSDGSGQLNNPRFQITYITRSLVRKKKLPGAYELLDQGREALKTLEFERGFVNITSEFFIGVDKGGIWMYGQTWEHTDFFE